MRILIGYDGSNHSEAIFNDLKRAGLPRDPKVKVVTVANLLAGAPPVRAMAAEVAGAARVTSTLFGAETHASRAGHEAKEFATEAVDRLLSEFPEWDVTSEVITGTPEWELLDAAKNWNADLIVVGSQGRSSIGRLLLGSVSKRAATDARCSVRVARPTDRKKEHAPPKIIVGIDGSPAAEAAVKEIGRRVWPEGTRIQLIAARDTPSPARFAAILPQAAGMIADFDLSLTNRAEAMLEWASYQLKAIGVNVSTSIQKGDPTRILLKEARKWNADSIFVGTRDFKNALDRFRLGSVSTAIVTTADTSVEIVRGPAAEYEID